MIVNYKDKRIKQIEKLCQEIAVDCTFNKKRNEFDDESWKS
jgi:hypothetical protein